MIQLAEGLTGIYFRMLIYPGLSSLAAISSVLTILFLRRFDRGVGVKTSGWEILGLWVPIIMASAVLPVPGSIPTFIAGDALVSLLLVHLAASRILGNDSMLQAVAAWTLALSSGALATLSNFLWQDWVRLATGQWNQAAVAAMAGTSFLFWAEPLLVGALPVVMSLPRITGSLARMSVGALAWFSAAAALLVALPPMEPEVFLASSMALSGAVLLLARLALLRVQVRQAIIVVGPLLSTSALTLAILSSKSLIGG